MLIVGILGTVILFFLLKLLSVSIKVIVKLVINGIMGLLILSVFNLFGSIAGVTLEFTAVNALVAGFFGIPGIIILLLFK